MRFYSTHNSQPLSGPIYCPHCGSGIGLDDLHTCEYIMPVALLVPDVRTRVVEFTKEKPRETYTAGDTFRIPYESNTTLVVICNREETHLRCFYPKGTCQCPCWFCRTQERES